MKDEWLETALKDIDAFIESSEGAIKILLEKGLINEKISNDNNPCNFSHTRM